MNFSLSYTGTTGDLSASLYCDGELVAGADGFKDIKAVEKWASQQARDWKIDNTPEATHAHSITGSKSFTL